ncbi:MAG: radical SAM protein [bacterium]|nr:radical SAM protein [bacterium]
MVQDFRKKTRYFSSFFRKKMLHLNLQILYQCNFKCQICDFWKEPYTTMPKLSAAQASIIAQKLKKMGPLIVSIGGGEPLLHNEFLDITRILARDNFPVMISNGWFMTPEKAKEIWEAGFYEVSISLDYASPEKHDARRGKKGAFERAVQALQYLNENRVYPHQRINMITTVTEDNLDDIEPLIQLSKEIGVTYMVSCYSSDRGTVPRTRENRDVSGLLLDLKKKYRDFVSIRGYLAGFSKAMNTEEGNTPCYAGKHLFNIDCQGDVTLCIDKLDSPAGNILTDDLEVIRAGLLEQYKNNTCGKCWTSCRGPVESLFYGKQRLLNYHDNRQLIRNVPIGGSF